MDWQSGKQLHKDVKLTSDIPIDMIEGVAHTMPRCSKTREIMRTNIGMRDDVDWIEEELANQLQKLNDYFQSPDINKRSITVIEIGAGPA